MRHFIRLVFAALFLQSCVKENKDFNDNFTLTDLHIKKGENWEALIDLENGYYPNSGTLNVHRKAKHIWLLYGKETLEEFHYNLSWEADTMLLSDQQGRNFKCIVGRDEREGKEIVTVEMRSEDLYLYGFKYTRGI